MTHACRSRGGIPIRLTSERWEHITQGHPEMAGLMFPVLEAVETGDSVHVGASGELLAVRRHTDGKHLIVVYRETQSDGFIITAFLTRRPQLVSRRERAWPT